MAPQYKHQPPSPDVLNTGGMVQTPAGFSGGSQTGSEYDFGTPQSFGIDSMMQSNDLNMAGHVLNHPSNPAGLPHGYSNAYEQAGLPQTTFPVGHMQHLGSMPGLQDGMVHHHRGSIGSMSGNTGSERHTSVPTMDGASFNGILGGGGIGENAYANRSNDSVTSQPRGDDFDGQRGDNQGNLPPAWSELKTKAGKERKRLPLACIACRRKKIRCSGEKPACKHCLRSRIPCVYKVTTRKAAPRTDYMAMLDKRLKRMEERVIKVIPKEDQGIVSSTGRAVVKPPLPAAPPKLAALSKKRAADTAFDDQLDEWADAKSTISGKEDTTRRDFKKEPLKLRDSDEYNLLLEGNEHLPSKELQEHLSEVFFDYVYGQTYPLLHKPSFMRKLATGQVPPVLMLAVCAISARFSNHPEVRTEPAFLRGEVWASAAREIALKRYDTPNITILIVYLILGLHEFGTCQGGRSWMFGGMAQRMAYALQLHKDLDHDPKIRRQSQEKSELTFTDREIRRRTMWSCFLMDRFNSSGTERPIFVGEQYIIAQLPIKESYYQMEITGPTEDLEGEVPNPVEPETGQIANAKDNMGISAYLIRLVAIWGKLINYMNLGGKELDKFTMWDQRSKWRILKLAAEAWRHTLPDSLVYSEENLQNHVSERIANQFLLLHIVHNQIILFLNRFALPSPGARSKHAMEMPSEFLTEASAAAQEAANQISALVHEAIDHQVVAPFAGYCAFYSSTVHIHGAFSQNPALEASSKQNLASNIKYLSRMKKYWGMFHFVTENLRDLYRRHADAARSGQKAGSRDSGDQSIFQYGDWFDRYPHGVSGTDYEEPSAEAAGEEGADAVLGQKSDLQTVEEFFSKLAPPTRAAQKEQQSTQRKMPKRKHTKSESKQSNSQDQDAKIALEPNEQPKEENMIPQRSMQDIPNFQQPPAGFQPGLQHNVNPYLVPPSQQYMSALDRHMVLNSYAGVSPSHFPNPNDAFGQSSDPTMLDPSGNFNLDNFDFSALNGNISPGAGWNQSTAWFMPFNMDPPAMGEDSGVFSGTGFDLSGFSGFGVPPGMPPTGLTPGGEADGDAGQDAFNDGSGGIP